MKWLVSPTKALSVELLGLVEGEEAVFLLFQLLVFPLHHREEPLFLMERLMGSLDVLAEFIWLQSELPELFVIHAFEVDDGIFPFRQAAQVYLVLELEVTYIFPPHAQNA